MRSWQMVIGAGLALLAACGSDDGVCGQIYDKQKACWLEKAKDPDDKEDIPTKAEFVAMCKAATRSRKEEIDMMAECSKLDGCDAIDKCVNDAQDAKYAKKRLGELQKQVSSGQWEDAFDTCRYQSSDNPSLEMTAACEKVFSEGVPELMKGPKADTVTSACQYSDDLKAKSPAFKKACTDVMSVTYEAKKKEVLAARDQGTDDYMKCSELQQAATGISDAAKTEADAMCAEMTAAGSAKQALDEANASIAAKKDETSYYCSSAADALLKLPSTDWSKKTLDQVLKTCFLDLGKVILEVELPGLSYCTYQLTTLRDAVKTYNLAGKDPDFDAQLAKTDKACGSATP